MIRIFLEFPKLRLVGGCGMIKYRGNIALEALSERERKDTYGLSIKAQ